MTDLRVSQIAAEVLRSSNPPVRVSQIAAEVLRNVSPSVRVSQIAAEVLRGAFDTVTANLGVAIESGATRSGGGIVQIETVSGAQVMLADSRLPIESTSPIIADSRLPIESGSAAFTADSRLPIETVSAAQSVLARSRLPIEFTSPITADSRLPIESMHDFGVEVQVTKLLGNVVLAQPNTNFVKLGASVVLVPPSTALTKLMASVVVVPPSTALTKLLGNVVIVPRVVVPTPLCAGIFPDSLPGITWSVHREVITQTRSQRAADGKELRALDYPWALRRWTLDFEFLRDSHDSRAPNPNVGFEELRTLMGFAGWAEGAYRCFCFIDPEDNYAQNAQLLMLNSWSPAVGDGVTLDFQFARSVPPNGVSEPVNAVHSLDAVYFDGFAAQSSGATWTISDVQQGILSFSVPPPVGVAISADIAYYWRARVQDDALSYENFMLRLWSQRRVQLLQCPPR